MWRMGTLLGRVSLISECVQIVMTEPSQLYARLTIIYSDEKLSVSGKTEKGNVAPLP